MREKWDGFPLCASPGAPEGPAEAAVFAKMRISHGSVRYMLVFLAIDLGFNI